MKFPAIFIILSIAASGIVSAGTSTGQLLFRAGTPNMEDGIKFVPLAPRDGNASIAEANGRSALKTDIRSQNPYIYFDVSRAKMIAYGYQPYHIVMEIEYYDSGSDSMAVQYDAMGDSIEANYKDIAWKKTNTRKWVTKSIEIKDAEFCNSQQGIADFRICADTNGDECIASISIRCLGAASKNPRTVLPEPKLGSKKWVACSVRQPVIILPHNISEEEKIALDRFCARFEYLGAQKPTISYRLPNNDGVRDGCDYIVIGNIHDDQIISISRILGDQVRKIKAIKDSSTRDQSYIVAKDHIGDSDVVYALGWGKMGIVFAISHLQTHLWYDGSKLAVHLDRTASMESPDFRQRELYINIGYGLSRDRITPDTWTIDDWKAYIDRLILARYNALSFYLWGDTEYAYPESNVNKEKNILLHRTLQEAIRYAHKRGIKVGYHITPTMVPYDVLAKHPELTSVLEYKADGIVCPSKEESWSIMLPVCRNEIEWFKDCDFFSIWFYDCGGCFCDQCRVPDQQLKTIVRQVSELDRIIQQMNPDAVVQVGTWGIWRYERMHNYSIRDRFMDEINRLFAGRKDKLIISDGIYIDPGCQPLFPLAIERGIAAKSFLYQTNIEDGQPFAMPMTRYFERWIPASKKAGASEIYLMRMETRTKYPQDFGGGYLFWNSTAKGRDALRLYSMYETGSANAGELLYKALMNIDDFTWYGYQRGAADAKRGELIYNEIKSAIDMLPKDRQRDLEWLLTTGAGYRVLGTAVEQMANEDTDGINHSMEKFRQALIGSPDFKAQVDSDAWINLSKSFVKFFYTGWETNHF